jgi:energy-coupling factor transporter ATP-binding protein EcfA2
VTGPSGIGKTTLVKEFSKIYHNRYDFVWWFHEEVNFDENLIKLVLKDKNFQLVLMGAMGPKLRDKEFAENALRDLTASCRDDFHWINSPNDQIFKQFLSASDLVLLHYDVGVSERRSSFLSAMSCAANVWTTVGVYSQPLQLNESGAHRIDSSDIENKIQSISLALDEDKALILNRRTHNFLWSQGRSWKKRAESVKL